MEYRTVDMAADPRREHFEHFMTMDAPFLTVTAQVDITGWLGKVRAAGYPFFLSFLYEAGAAANSVPELRRRIRSGGVIEYPVCGSSFTVACADGTYRYCSVRTDLPFEEYLRAAAEAQRAAEGAEHLTEEDDPESCFYVSSLPWLSYSALELPKPDRFFSVPSLTWGRFRTETVPVKQDGGYGFFERTLLPVTLMTHHALTDGRHIAAFFEALKKRLALPGEPV